MNYSDRWVDYKLEYHPQRMEHEQKIAQKGSLATTIRNKIEWIIHKFLIIIQN